MTMAAGNYASMRASDEDRWRVQAHLNEAFAEGRLNQQEWDERVTALGSARTYGDLDMLTADLPRPNLLAVPHPPAMFPQHQTDRPGEQGDGMARAGQLMGYVGLSLAIAGVLVFLAVALWAARAGHPVFLRHR
jgi:Domain of unknown function (DUF1707)